MLDSGAQVADVVPGFLVFAAGPIWWPTGFPVLQGQMPAGEERVQAVIQHDHSQHSEAILAIGLWLSNFRAAAAQDVAGRSEQRIQARQRLTQQPFLSAQRYYREASDKLDVQLPGRLAESSARDWPHSPTWRPCGPARPWSTTCRPCPRPAASPEHDRPVFGCGRRAAGLTWWHLRWARGVLAEVISDRPEVFISYSRSRRDAAPGVRPGRAAGKRWLARKVAFDLMDVVIEAAARAGDQVWRDESSMTVGDQLGLTIDAALLSCAGAIIFLDPDALVRSPWVRWESSILTWRQRIGMPVRVVPVLIEVGPEQLSRHGYGPSRLDQTLAHIVKLAGITPVPGLR